MAPSRRASGALAGLALCAALACAAALLPAAAAAESPEWSVYRSNIKQMQCPGVKGGTVGEALGAFLDYNFDLPLEFYRKAMVSFHTHTHTPPPGTHARVA